jgi:nondiscriminating aspartyl-tRNA synthetase
MERTLASKLAQQIEREVTIRGWLHTMRAMGKLNFLILRDRTGLAQIVIESKDEAKKLAELQPGSILTVRGKIVKSSQAELGVEMIHPSC